MTATGMMIALGLCVWVGMMIGSARREARGEMTTEWVQDQIRRSGRK